VASPVRKPTREAQGSADQSMKKPILVSLILHKEPLKTLMLVASTARWSSWDPDRRETEKRETEERETEQRETEKRETEMQ